MDPESRCITMAGPIYDFVTLFLFTYFKLELDICNLFDFSSKKLILPDNSFCFCQIFC